MKKFLLGLLLASTLGSLSACKESSKIPAPPVTSIPLIFPKLSSDITKSYFDTRRAGASIDNLPNLADPTRPILEFTLDIPDQRDVQIQSVEVYKSFFRPSDSRIGPRVFSGSYSSFPATVSINSQQALTGLQRLIILAGSPLPRLSNLLGALTSDRNPVLNGDVIIFTFEYVLADGSRIILTPLADIKLFGGAAAKVISGTQINPPYALYAKIQSL